ncbi:hypothetical protein DERF_005612 [Dermatophagoides farinae]|uniref:G-protein coupled receptors family 1 profile domain-containing protein n=1 Tax=Dermatophagoides farinae TaxID=6954 RepID=A0A922L7B5_DERFA|nr:hypothetical protein DERF_005612 [Dermatophagoides farinae]
MIQSNQGIIGHYLPPGSNGGISGSLGGGNVQFSQHNHHHHYHHDNNHTSSQQMNQSKMIISLLLNNSSTSSPSLSLSSSSPSSSSMLLYNNNNNNETTINSTIINYTNIKNLDNKSDIHIINHNNNSNNNLLCQPHAPVEMLDEWEQMLFGSSIFITAIITFLLNLFVIITLILNRYCNAEQSGGGSRQNSLSTTSTMVNTSSQYKNNNLVNKRLSNDSTIVRGVVSSIATTTATTTTTTTATATTSRSFSHTQQSFISLSISVILYSSICVPAMYLETIEILPTTTTTTTTTTLCSNYYCFIITSLRFGFYVAPIASSFMHLLMAFDRYLAIKQCYLFQSYWYRRHYTLCIMLVWMASILIIIPFFWYHQFGRTIQILLTLIRLMFTFSIPSLLTLYLYLSIACELKRVAVETIIVTPFITNNRLISKHREIIAKIILLALIHFLCWFPFSVMESLNDLFPDLFRQCDFQIQTYYSIMAILILFTSMSGIAYPILYCFVSSEYRKIFSQKLTMFSFFTCQSIIESNVPRRQSSSLNITKIEEHPTSIIIDDHAIDNGVIHNNKFHHNQQIDFESSSMIMKPATTLLALDLIIMNNNNRHNIININNNIMADFAIDDHQQQHHVDDHQ